MIDGTVPTEGRKRSVWWVDPRLVQPFVALPMDRASAARREPPPGAPGRLETGIRVGERFEAIAGGLALGAAARLLAPGGARRRIGCAARRPRRRHGHVDGDAGHARAGRSPEVLGGIRCAAAPSAPTRARMGVLRHLPLRRASSSASSSTDVDRRSAGEAQQARQLREARDAALSARLAPHFIFNALGTLQAQIEKDPAAATDTVDRLARLFRQALSAAGRPTVPLREELEFVESYLGIERSRLGHRLRVKVDVPEELEEIEIPPLSLQVLVENAVQHGIAPREDGGEIRIRARRSGPGENPGIVLSVANPLAPSSRPGTGNGLESLRGRLASPGDLAVLVLRRPLPRRVLVERGVNGRPVRVVVVEDEPLALARLCDLLAEQPGVDVVARAPNGREGLAAVAGAPPDAVFLDVEMPGMSGTELMHVLPEPRPDVVFVTAYAAARRGGLRRGGGALPPQAGEPRGRGPGAVAAAAEGGSAAGGLAADPGPAAERDAAAPARGGGRAGRRPGRLHGVDRGGGPSGGRDARPLGGEAGVERASCACTGRRWCGSRRCGRSRTDDELVLRGREDRREPEEADRGDPGRFRG